MKTYNTDPSIIVQLQY